MTTLFEKLNTSKEISAKVSEILSGLEFIKIGQTKEGKDLVDKYVSFANRLQSGREAYTQGEYTIFTKESYLMYGRLVEVLGEDDASKFVGDIFDRKDYFKDIVDKKDSISKATIEESQRWLLKISAVNTRAGLDLAKQIENQLNP